VSIEITQSLFILCEGEGDQSFFRHLLEQRGLSSDTKGFDIYYPSEKHGIMTGGIEGYTQILAGLWSDPLKL